MPAGVHQTTATAVHDVAIGVIDGNLLAFVLLFLDVAHVGQTQLVDSLVVTDFQHFLHFALHLV